jgi:hypothetical protein
MEEKDATRVMVQLYAETIVLGWTGVKGSDGKTIKHSVEAAVKLFTELPPLFDLIRRAADKLELFRKRLVEADAGNSSKS